MEIKDVKNAAESLHAAHLTTTRRAEEVLMLGMAQTAATTASQRFPFYSMQTSLQGTLGEYTSTHRMTNLKDRQCKLKRVYTEAMKRNSTGHSWPEKPRPPIPLCVKVHKTMQENPGTFYTIFLPSRHPFPFRRPVIPLHSDKEHGLSQVLVHGHQLSSPAPSRGHAAHIALPTSHEHTRPERRQVGVHRRRAHADGARAPAEQVAQVVREQLEVVGSKLVLVHQHMEVHGAIGALQPSVRVQVEVKLVGVADPGVHHHAWWHVAGAVRLAWVHAEEPSLVPLLHHADGDGGRVPRVGACHVQAGLADGGVLELGHVIELALAHAVPIEHDGLGLLAVVALVKLHQQVSSLQGNEMA